MKKLLLGLITICSAFGAYVIYTRYTVCNYTYINVGVLNDANHFATVNGNKATGIEPLILESIVDLMNKEQENKNVVAELKSTTNDVNKNAVVELKNVNNNTKSCSNKKTLVLKYKSYSTLESLIKAIKSNEVSIGSGAITIRHDRKDIKFSNGFQKVNQVILSRDNKLSQLSQLKNKKIGVKSGSTSEDFIKSKKLNSEIIVANSKKDLIDMLKTGAIDVIIMDNTITHSPELNSGEYIYNIFEAKTEEYGFILSEIVDANDFNKKLNIVLANQNTKPKQEEKNTQQNKK